MGRGWLPRLLWTRWLQAVAFNLALLRSQWRLQISLLGVNKIGSVVGTCRRSDGLIRFDHHSSLSLSRLPVAIGCDINNVTRPANPGHRIAPFDGDAQREYHACPTVSVQYCSLAGATGAGR